jgi:hypothetical protein
VLVGTAAGLILINGGSSGSAHTTCRLLPNHRLILILNMQQELPAKSDLHLAHGETCTGYAARFPAPDALLIG